MKYNVGDRVKIKSRKEIENLIEITNSMLEKCETVMTIEACHPNCASYHMKEDNPKFLWADEMIEGLVEEENLIERVDDNGLPFNEWLSHKGFFYVPDGYELKDENGNVINATKIVLEKKKKKEYPKTFVEVLNYWYPDRQLEDGYQRGYKKYLIEKFQDLLYARDAYWKIAGEEMGLGKPWKPNWEDENQEKHIIGSWLGTIQGLEENFVSHPLAFPTEEMRDAFYENFKELIEQCKELL